MALIPGQLLYLATLSGLLSMLTAPFLAVVGAEVWRTALLVGLLLFAVAASLLLPNLVWRIGTGIEAALRWLLAYPLVTGQIAIMLLVSWAGLGKDLGAERLFWHEDWLVQLGTGISIGMLYGSILLTMYITYRPTVLVKWLRVPWRATSFAARRRALTRGWWHRVTLFPSADREVRLAGRFILLGLLLLLTVTVVGKGYAAYQDHVSISKANEDEQELAKEEGRAPAAPMVSKYLEERKYLWPHVVGYLLSLVIARVLFLLDEWRSIRTTLLKVPVWSMTRKWHPLRSRLAVDLKVPSPQWPLHGISAFLGILSVVGFIVLIGIAEWLDVSRPGKSFATPVTFVSFMLILFTLLYGLFSFHFHVQRLVFGGVAVALLAWNSTCFWKKDGNGEEDRYSHNHYKLQFPGFEGSGADVDLPLWSRTGAKRDIENVLDPTQGYARQHLIPADEPLRAMCERWQREQGRPDDKPRVIIVCTSGGGIRASVWTGVVLQQLDEKSARSRTDPNTFNEKDRFRDHIRLFTGASGGMVGVTLYVADFEHVPDDDPAKRPRFTERHVDVLAADSLSRTAQSLVLRDMLRNTILVPPWRHAEWDRGRTLEWKWELNADELIAPKDDARRASWKNPWQKTFAELRGPRPGDPAAATRRSEWLGQRPSVIYSPLMVEDARRLLISNLDLSGLRRPAKGDPKKPGPDKSDPDQLADLSLAVGPHGMAARSAVEFHRLFPDVAPGATDEWRDRLLSDKFKVVTAARMNATFPVISPAVSLPTAPPRRLVDAGIYDNYGVNLAAAWMLKNRDALRRYTSGVALVQVRAFPLHNARTKFASFDPDTGKLEGEPSQGDLISDMFAAISAPAEALLAARSNAAFFRNAEQLEALHRVFNNAAAPVKRKKGEADEEAFKRQFFTTVWLELRRPAALNWYLTDVEKESIKGAWKDNDVQAEVERLFTWFGDGGR